jgi:hypothetical protein
MLFQLWREHLGAIGLGLLLVAVLTYAVVWRAEPITKTTERRGILDALHQGQGNTGSNVSFFYVRLSTDEMVTVTPPPMTPFKQGASVRILEVTKKSGRKSYAYLGYAEAASNTTPHADARDVPALAKASGARAGGRER